MKHYVKKFIKIFLTTFIVVAVIGVVAFLGAVFGYWGSFDEIDVNSLTLNQTSVIVYDDPTTGEEAELYKLDSAENREWADIADIPEDLQKAIISIEDERFMEHKGYDLPRTVKATLVYIGKKITGNTGTSLGGSTITQQLIKNVTGDNDQTATRKIKEISRAVALEKQLDKTQILELYLNCIYLSHGCNGVQTAARTYFDKDVSELDLAECASIAGITQNPAAYDPIVNPDKNKERQSVVLGKMLELGYISQDEYESAINEKLKIVEKTDTEKTDTVKTTSYFVDQVITDVLNDLQDLGYSKNLASKILYSGGVKIKAAYEPEIQKIVEKYYENAKNFPGSGVQSAITVLDVQTGQVVGIAGGLGEKTASLTLNRASGSPRQPGSTMKPIAAYLPALENGIIYPGSIFEDAKKNYDGWIPRNYDYQYRGKVDVRTALRRSLNTTPVEIINTMGPQVSYDYLTEKFGLTTLVKSREIDGKIYTDVGLSQLALGGLTDGATTLEMAAAYASFANGGYHYKPYTYTEVTDKDGNVILSSDRTGASIMKESNAYIMTKLLQEVVESGTGVGASVSGVSYTAGKTGTTSDDKDRWFIGYTPYYVAAIWYGYDIPKELPSSSNPCIPAFRSIMNSIHGTLKSTSKSLDKPKDVTNVSYCTYTGMRATSSCPSTSYYCDKDKLPGYCNLEHSGGSISASSESTKKSTQSSSSSSRNNDDDDSSSTSSSSSNSSRGNSNSSNSASTSNASSSTSGTSSSSASTSSSTGSSSAGSSNASSGNSGSSSSSGTANRQLEE